MTRYTVNFLLDKQFIGDMVTTNQVPILPRVGEEVRISGMYLKVTRVVHVVQSYTVEVHLSR